MSIAKIQNTIKIKKAYPFKDKPLQKIWTNIHFPTKFFA